MESGELGKLTEELKEKYPDSGIQSIELDENTGKSTFYLTPTQKNLAFLEDPSKAVTPHAYRSSGSTINRDTMGRSNLDLSMGNDAYDEDPKESYKKALRYYHTEPIVGTTINLLSSLAVKGFELDIDDENIRDFYNTWMFDVNMEEVLEWIFLDFFKVGHVHTYKAVSKYEPRVSTLSPAPGKKLNNTETGAAKKIWSKGHLPTAYTVLNPLLVNIEGNLLFNNTSVKLTPPTGLKDLLNKAQAELTDEEKGLIKSLPTDFKKAAKDGKEFQLDPRLVGSITYRKQPYERYAKPKMAKIFESLNYKKALRDADLSTLDGISNYILKITIGNDEYPVTSQEELESVAELFNTPSKSFDVVWNHTLDVQKIVSPEIEAVLGQEKYTQVNEDITGGLGISRALIDGIGNQSQGEVEMVVKGITEEIMYARRQVNRWLYKEFRQIAEAMGFDRFPKVRWDNSILKDILLYMNTVSQLVDRRMLSYQTALEILGFDYPNEKRNMESEFSLVEEGIFGIIGSPWQQSGVQSTQRSPEGTPSNGRPKSEPTGKNSKETDPQKINNQKTKQQTKPKSQEQSGLEEVVKNMPPEEYAEFINYIEETRRSN